MTVKQTSWHYRYYTWIRERHNAVNIWDDPLVCKYSGTLVGFSLLTPVMLICAPFVLACIGIEKLLDGRSICPFGKVIRK